MCMDIYKNIINEYFNDMSITPFDINIVETTDVKSAYYKIRPDQIGKDDKSDGYYNGFCVPPKDNDGLFTILLDKNNIDRSKENGNYNWVGTIVHETTHADDYIKYRQLISAQSYDELYDHNKHRIFGFWTEYHSRVMGQHYVIKYSIANNHPCGNEEYVMNTEMEKLLKWYNETPAESGDKLLELLATLLGMISAWEDNFHDSFNNSFVHELFQDTPDMENLYELLREHNIIEKAVPHFDKLYQLLKILYPEMP